MSKEVTNCSQRKISFWVKYSWPLITWPSELVKILIELNINLMKKVVQKENKSKLKKYKANIKMPKIKMTQTFSKDQNMRASN